MLQGTFFKVDDNSDFQNGQIIFRYLSVKLNENNGGKIDQEYPVYLVLTPHSVDFFYHDLSLEKSTVNNNENNIKTVHSHSHICFLHLPLSLNLAAKDNLSSKLNSFFSGIYKIPNNLYLIDYSDADFQSYWNLKVFGLTEPEKQKSDTIYLRKLILDFLFDLEHSRVFEASPNYEQVEVRLRENFLFSAISAKASYYYNVKIYIENFTNDEVREIYAKRIVDAEKQWLNIIRDDRSIDIFCHSGWFDKLEKEYDGVIFPQEFNRDNWRKELIYLYGGDESYEEQNIRILKISARWYLRRYNLVKGIGTILQFYSNRKFLLFLSIFVFLVLMPMLLADINNQHSIVSFVFYVTIGLFPLSFFILFILWKMKIPLISASLPRLLMAISSAWIIFSTTEELVKGSFDAEFLGSGMFLTFLLLIPVFFFMAVEINNMAPEIEAKKMLLRIFYIFGLGFFYSILIGMFFIHYSGEKILVRSGYLSQFISNCLNSNSDFKLDDELLATAIGLSNENNFIFEEYRNSADSILHLPESLEIINTLELKHSLNSTEKIKLAYFFRNCNFRNYSTISRKKKIAWVKKIIFPSDNIAIEELTNVSYNLSFLGEVKLLYRVPIYKNFSFNIFPGMLFVRSIVALFIGIFIQLIFEEKPITEPL